MNTNALSASGYNNRDFDLADNGSVFEIDSVNRYYYKNNVNELENNKVI